jgi:hypothetical protein
VDALSEIDAMLSRMHRGLPDTSGTQETIPDTTAPPKPCAMFQDDHVDGTTVHKQGLLTWTSASTPDNIPPSGLTHLLSPPQTT